jgi:hypothetical protein
MTAKYLIWTYERVPSACVLDELAGLDKTSRLNHGVPLLAQFPENVSFHMHGDFPKNLLLVDNLLNSDQVIVASSRVKEFLEARAVPQVEYLPVRIIDHKRKVASKDYFIVHAVDPVDCIDTKKSAFKMSRINPQRFDRFERLVIDESRVPADRQLFRLKNFGDVTLARRDLADALKQAGFTGIGWVELSEYPDKK